MDRNTNSRTAEIDTEHGRSADPAPHPGRPEGEVAQYFRAVALDYDGTLAEHDTVPADTLAALEETRSRGVRLVLVTGRALDDLRDVFPDAEVRMDAVVAENGAVVVTPFGTRLLAPPVDDRLTRALRGRGVACRTGDVLVGCAGADELIVLEEVRRLGLDCQLVRNRAQLMVLPGGVSKGTGLYEALGDLGISHHNTVAVGDAENDLSLLQVAEIGVAVGNAVPAVREHADLVLDQPAGAGVAELLRGGLLTGSTHIYPGRWQLRLGTDAQGGDVRVPASQLNVLISGGTGEGKSYLAGLFVEQLVSLGYSVLAVDPEGDHTGLGALRGVLVLGPDELPAPDRIGRLLRLRFSTLVLDLAGLELEAQSRYLQQLPGPVRAERAAVGLPQWVLLDEADRTLGRGGATDLFDPASKGHCIVTWRPEDLSPDVAAGIDAVVALTGPQPSEGLVDIMAAVCALPRATVAGLLAGPPGRGVLAWRARPREATTFTLGARSTPHLRHQHKYEAAGLSVDRGFYFRNAADRLTGVSAGNLDELADGVAACDAGTLRHHCTRADFSRWSQDVLHDPWLAETLDQAEKRITEDSTEPDVDQVRAAMVGALRRRRAA